MYLVQPFRAHGFSVEAMRERTRSSATEAVELAQHEVERADAVLVWRMQPRTGCDPWDGAELHASFGAADLIGRLPRA